MRYFGKVGRPGRFKLSLAIQGFIDSRLDWSGFSEESEALGRGTLIDWRLRGGDFSFESDDVVLPSESTDSFEAHVKHIISELSFRAEGMRHHPITGSRSSRLALSTQSISRVIESARSEVRGTKTSAPTDRLSTAINKLRDDLVRANNQLGSNQDADWWREFLDARWPSWHRRILDAMRIWDNSFSMLTASRDLYDQVEIWVLNADSLIRRQFQPKWPELPSPGAAQKLGQILLDIAGALSNFFPEASGEI